MVQQISKIKELPYDSRSAKQTFLRRHVLNCILIIKVKTKIYILRNYQRLPKSQISCSLDLSFQYISHCNGIYCEAFQICFRCEAFWTFEEEDPAATSVRWSDGVQVTFSETPYQVILNQYILYFLKRASQKQKF